MSHSQRFHMGILLHVLYSNPKVLYAPNNTEVDEIIRKVTTAHVSGMRTNMRSCMDIVFIGQSHVYCLDGLFYTMVLLHIDLCVIA